MFWQTTGEPFLCCQPQANTFRFHPKNYTEQNLEYDLIPPLSKPNPLNWMKRTKTDFYTMVQPQNGIDVKKANSPSIFVYLIFSSYNLLHPHTITLGPILSLYTLEIPLHLHMRNGFTAR